MNLLSILAPASMADRPIASFALTTIGTVIRKHHGLHYTLKSGHHAGLELAPPSNILTPAKEERDADSEGLGL